MGRKPKPSAIPEVCAAVRRVRTTLGESQEHFGRRVNLSLMTVSRFELGKQVPRDRAVLTALAKAARDSGLDPEANLFEQRARQSASGPRVSVAEHEFALFQETLDVIAKAIPLLVDPTHEVADADKARIGQSVMLRIAYSSWLVPASRSESD